MTKLKKINRTYIMILLLIVLSVICFSASYAFFTSINEEHGKLNIVVGNLTYKLESNEFKNHQITVNSGETKEFLVTLSSLNSIDSKYELYYTLEQEDSNVRVGYSNDTKDAVLGKISANGSKTITVGINNGSDRSVTITFSVIGGLVNNELVLTEGYSLNQVIETKVGAPIIAGGSDNWVSVAPTISVLQAGSALSGVKHYEYYKSTTNKKPGNSTTATGTTLDNLTISDEGTTYVWYRTVSNNGNKSVWTGPQVVNLDTITPVLALESTKYCSGIQVASGTSSDDLLEYTLTQTNNSVSGSTILYCIDTNNTCTPNIEYKEKVYARNNGRYYFRYRITSGAGKSFSSTYTAVVNDTTYCAVNLIKNGSFEQGDTRWKDIKYGNNFTISNTDSYSGNKSIQFAYTNIDTVSMSGQYLEMDTPELNHKYYGSIMFKSSNTFTTNDSRFEWYSGERDGESTLIFANKNTKTNNIWTKLSAIKSVTTSKYLSQKWVIRNFQRGANEYSYSDDLTLIDLTDTFGAGNEPDKEWCDNNLSWFEGKKIIYK